MDTLPATIVSQALQALFECLNTVAADVPAHKRQAFDANVKRIQGARTRLETWVDEQRTLPG